MSHLVRAWLDAGALPLCRTHDTVADKRGKDGTAYGHLWLDAPGTGPFPEPEFPGQSRRYYCVTRVLPAPETAAEEVA